MRMNSNNKFSIGVISIYFGTFPNYFPQWLESCRWNPSIDFLLITDQNIPLSLPENVHIIKSNLSETKRKFEEALGQPVELEKSYKLCDYKPMYGLAFQEYLKNYDFWGHCDLDLIWGDIRKFVTDDILKVYDKILPLGHLSIFRNNDEVNNYFKLPGSRRGNYEDVIRTNKICVFDETYGINAILEANELPIYSKEVAADISFRNQRMIIAGKQHNNYKYQIFYIKNGRCLRAYIDSENNIRTDEFAYIHLQKRHYNNVINSNNYIVGQNDFFELPSIITKETIETYNHSKPKFYEKLEFIYKDYKFRILRRIKQAFIK